VAVMAPGRSEGLAGWLPRAVVGMWRLFNPDVLLPLGEMATSRRFQRRGGHPQGRVAATSMADKPWPVTLAPALQARSCILPRYP